MMTSVAQSRALTGARAFGTARPRVASHITHVAGPVPAGYGKKNRSYMVEVEVAEDEPEDVAVRRYMKLVMQSRVIEQLRARKTKETKIEEYKRRFRERVELRKAGVVEPLYDELYPPIEGPFNDFFMARDRDDHEGPFDLNSGAEDIFGSFGAGSFQQGAYGGSWSQDGSVAQTGGYIASNNYGSSSSWQGGYM